MDTAIFPLAPMSMETFPATGNALISTFVRSCAETAATAKMEEEARGEENVQFSFAFLTSSPEPDSQLIGLLANDVMSSEIC